MTKKKTDVPIDREAEQAISDVTKARMREAGTLYTSNWDVLDHKRIPRWPSPVGEKRPIKVDINSWEGTCPGAIHWTVTVEEGDNEYWSESKACWVRIGDNMYNGPCEMRATFLNEHDAAKCAIEYIKLLCGPDMPNHRLSWMTHIPQPKGLTCSRD